MSNNQPSGSPLPTITRAHDACSLTIEQAAQSYPAHLRAVVTYYDAYNDPRPACFASNPVRLLDVLEFHLV